MNNKLSSKPSKKDRPRSTDKSSKPKRRGDQTPEKGMTPVPSVLGVTDESNPNQTTGYVLSGEEIESLAINMEELQKNRPPKHSVVEKTSHQVTVRKLLKGKEVPVLNSKNGKTVTVAHPMSSDSEFNNYKIIGNNDPSLDDEIPFFEHHILGTMEEFKEQNEKKRQAKKIPISHNDKVHYPGPNTKVVKRQVFSSCIYKPNMDQSNALNNWERQMAERRKQQGHLARLLNTSTEILGMNQGEDYRTMQEERHLIDRSIHSQDYGKGYRIGSEFWKQAELIGDDETGVHMSLTQTERGYPPVIEHIGKPLTVKKEMGLDWSDSESYRSAIIHRPWKKSTYLQTRKEELKEAINKLCPHKPYLNELEIVGETFESQMAASADTKDVEIMNMDSRTYTSRTDGILREDNDPLSVHPDVFPQLIFGPSLMIAGRSAQWNGSTHNRLGEVGISCRVVLEAKVNERVASTLDVLNDGTTAIYYSWKSVLKVNKLGTTLAGNQQRFYFDKNSGVILSGDTLKFPFIFKSTNPGMFSEEWQLDTQPVLNGGAAIRVVLRGVALQDDLNVDKRKFVEKELEGRQARQIVQSIVQEILEGIRSPERPASPVDAYLTDEESFARKNPEMCYNEEVIEELKQLYHDINPDGEWDLTISSLRQHIMTSNYEDEEQLDGYLSRLNLHVKDLAFAPRFPVKEEMYSTCYVMLCELVDDIVTHSRMLRSTMGLPLKEIVDDNPGMDDGHEKRTKKLTEGTRLTVEKKESRKEKRSAERSISSPKPKILSDRKSAKGSSHNQAKSVENQDEVTIRISTSEITPLEQPASVVSEDHYKEKLYCQAYGLVSEAVEKIAGMFEDIENSQT